MVAMASLSDSGGGGGGGGGVLCVGHTRSGRRQGCSAWCTRRRTMTWRRSGSRASAPRLRGRTEKGAAPARGRRGHCLSSPCGRRQWSRRWCGCRRQRKMLLEDSGTIYVRASLLSDAVRKPGPAAGRHCLHKMQYCSEFQWTKCTKCSEIC